MVERREIVDVAIVGAGFAGLGLGLQLAERGRESFVVLERADAVGGTWRDNTYPGVACDIPSHVYSYSFVPPADWSRVFATGAEIQDYLLRCAAHPGLAPQLRLGTDVLDARWDEHGHWVLTTSAGVVQARTLVMAVGRLSEPRIPEVPGLADFTGPAFHTARWDDDLDLTGLRVGVVGTGASAVQLVPRLVGTAAGVVVFQRTATYVVPRADRTYDDAERQAFRDDPDLARALRAELIADQDRGIGARLDAGHDRDRLHALALGHLASQVVDPGLREALTPDYEIGCKRVVLSDDFYPALTDPAVHLEVAALDRVEGPRTAVAANGATHDIDVLVFATGFHTTRLPFATRVRGRGGLSLDEHWSSGMTSHASTAVHGFPNLFVLDGPNASLGHNSAVEMIETQIGYVLGALDHLATRPGAALQATAAAEAAYTREIDLRSRDSVWLRGGCTNWYVDERTHRLTLLWPGSLASFRERNGRFDPEAYELLSPAP